MSCFGDFDYFAQGPQFGRTNLSWSMLIVVTGYRLFRNTLVCKQFKQLASLCLTQSQYPLKSKILEVHR